MNQQDLVVLERGMNKLKVGVPQIDLYNYTAGLLQDLMCTV